MLFLFITAVAAMGKVGSKVLREATVDGVQVQVSVITHTHTLQA